MLADEKKVVVADHHEPETEGSFTHVNPHFNGFDGGESISAAGVSYLVADSEGVNTDLVKYALIGATGDIQKQDGEFLGLNQDLEEKAINEGVVEKRTGLNLYGRSTKPLHKALMYTTDPYLEGITNSESGAIQFLKSLDLDLRDNGSFRTLSDLDPQEEQKIVEGLIMKGYPGEDLVQNIHILDNGKGIDEYSTIINACGRLGEPKTGVKILRNDDLETAESISRRYGRRISSALGMVEDNKDNSSFVFEKEIGIIDAGSEISKEFIGPVTTITMSNDFFNAPVVAGVAEAEENKHKFSVRASKDLVDDGLNLGEVISEICEELGAEGGGHNVAAGAKVDPDSKQEFIEHLNQRIKDHAKDPA